MKRYSDATMSEVVVGLNKLVVTRVAGVALALGLPFLVCAGALAFVPGWTSLAWMLATPVGAVGLFVVFRRPLWLPWLITIAYAPVMLAATMMFSIKLQCQLYPWTPTSFICPGGYGDTIEVRRWKDGHQSPSP